MTIPLVLNALAYGFNAKSVLGHVSKQYPKYSKAINAAMAYGYPAATILKKIVDPHSTGEDSDQYMTQEERMFKADKRNTRKAWGQVAGGVAASGALGAGALGLLSRGASAAAQGVAGAVQSASPPPGGPTVPPGGGPPGGLTQQGMINQGLALGQKPQAPTQTGPTPIAPNQALPLQPEEQKFLDSYPQVTRVIDSHLARGKTPEEISNVLNSSKAMSPIVKNFEKIHGTPFASVIQQRQSPIEPKAELPTQQKGPTPMKSDIVITPFGAGNVHKVHKDNAYVNVDGKLKKVPIKELEEPSPEAQTAVADFLGIPEEDRSSNVALWFHDTQDDAMWVQWHHGGKFTKYKGFPNSLLEEIAAKNATPITTGQNQFGEWSPNDKKSLGAAINKYIKNDPRWKKSSAGETANENYVTYEPGYDYWHGLRKQPKRKK